MDRIESLGLRGREPGHARAATIESPDFEATVNLADHILADAIGFDDGQGTFDGHAGLRRALLRPDRWLAAGCVLRAREGHVSGSENSREVYLCLMRLKRKASRSR